MSTNVSKDLLWSIVRGFNSHQVRRHNGFVSTTFSKERGNLTNTNSSKFSGISNASSFDVRKTHKGVQLSQGRRRQANRPVKSVNVTLFKNANRKQKITNAVSGQVSPTLKESALKRWARVYRTTRRSAFRATVLKKANKGKQGKGKEEKQTKTSSINDVN